MRWGENETVRFTELYLREECLWNPGHVGYKIKQERIKSYRKIISEFKQSTGISLGELELKSKIRNLRSTYSLELKKIRRLSTPDYEYRPNIRWFENWHRCFSSKAVMSDASFDGTDNGSKMWISKNDDEIPSDPTMSHDNNGEYTLYLKSEPNDSQNTEDLEDEEYIPSKKRKSLKHRSLSTDISDRTYRGSLCSNPESHKEDEFDIYGKHIATQLRSMDLQRALQLQIEIQNLVGQARISDLSK